MMPPPDFWQEEGAERPAQEVGNQSPAHDLLGLIKSRVLRLQGRLQGTAALCANIADVIWQERLQETGQEAEQQETQATMRRCSKNFVLAQNKQVTSWHAG